MTTFSHSDYLGSYISGFSMLKQGLGSTLSRQQLWPGGFLPEGEDLFLLDKRRIRGMFPVHQEVDGTILLYMNR